MFNKIKKDQLVYMLNRYCYCIIKELENGIPSKTVVEINQLLWSGIKEAGCTPSDVAVAFDSLFRLKLGENYTWNDCVLLNSSVKKKLSDNYGVVIKISDLEQSALNLVKEFYVTANNHDF